MYKRADDVVTSPLILCYIYTSWEWWNFDLFTIVGCVKEMYLSLLGRKWDVSSWIAPYSIASMIGLGGVKNSLVIHLFLEGWCWARPCKGNTRGWTIGTHTYLLSFWEVHPRYLNYSIGIHTGPGAAKVGRGTWRADKFTSDLHAHSWRAWRRPGWFWPASARAAATGWPGPAHSFQGPQGEPDTMGFYALHHNIAVIWRKQIWKWVNSHRPSRATVYKWMIIKAIKYAWSSHQIK